MSCVLGVMLFFLVSEDHLEALLTRGRGRGVVEYVPCTCDVSYVDWGRTTRSWDSSRRKEGKKRNVVIPGLDVEIFRLDGVSSSFFSFVYTTHTRRLFISILLCIAQLVCCRTLDDLFIQYYRFAM